MYKLEGKRAVPVEDLMEWAFIMEKMERRVAVDIIEGVRVSTVFLGLDFNHFGKGDPLLFETMVFCDAGESGIMERYFIWEEAEEGHRRIVAIVKAQIEASKEVSLKAISEFMGKVTK